MPDQLSCFKKVPIQGLIATSRSGIGFIIGEKKHFYIQIKISNLSMQFDSIIVNLHVFTSAYMYLQVLTCIYMYLHPLFVTFWIINHMDYI